MRYEAELFAAGLFLLTAVPIASAYTQDQLHWVDWVSGVVYWGDDFSFDNYILRAADFPVLDEFQMVSTPFVKLDLFENGTYITSFPLALGDEYIYKDEIRISITELVSAEQVKWRGDLYNPHATIKVERLGSPSLSPSYSVTFENQKRFTEWEKVNCTVATGVKKEWVTKWVYDEDYGRYRRVRSYEPADSTATACNDTYTLISSTNEVLSIPPGSTITVKVKVSNTGTADAYNVSMKVIPDLTVKEGKLDYYEGDLEIGEESSERTIELIAPGGLSDTKQYSVHVIATGNDIKGNPVSSDTYFNFNIGKQWGLLLNKYATSSLRLNGTAYVTLTAYNDGWLDLRNIRITDAASDKFTSSRGNSSWVINLPAGEDWSANYTLKPREVGTFNHPEARADFELNGMDYTLYSGRPSTVVHGVLIRLEKTTDIEFIERNKTTDVTVSVTARNIGDIDALVTARDYGITREKVIKAGESYSFSYTIPISNETSLPPATASYLTLYGDKGSIISNQVVLRTAAFETQTTSETKAQAPRIGKNTEPAYIIIYIVLILASGVFLWMRRKSPF